ncbi:hypothetical protein LTR84_011604 [Exophiala bonariae]|uniref:Cytochrome P450 monooxygenase n=1 Tax=Exophiala bonariae TaxID=1690606 RepID=A0AAV9NKW5_9EURO|nr:hypothetical protein LTR84_011604 [Exophiala bonariae]
MAFASTGWTAVISLSGAILGLFIYRVCLHPLSSIPGPLSAKLSGSWRNTRYWRGTWHNDIVDVHKRYGPVVRIAPNEVSIVDQQAMKTLYGHGSNAAKTQWYATWNPPIGAPAFFAVREKKLHSFLRKRVSGAYTMSAILKYEPRIQACLDLLLRKLQNHAVSGKAVNMSEWTNAFAFDVIGQLAYGSPLGHLDTESDVMELRKNIFNLFFLAANMGHYSGQMKLFTNPLTQSILALCGIKNRIAEFQEWSSNRVQARIDALERNGGSDKDRPDMLAHFLNMKDTKGNRVRTEEVLSEALNLVGAGADTTSIAIRACIHAICSRKIVYNRLQAEIDEYYNENTLTQPITYLQCQNLPYLVAATREAMRLLPSIVYQLLRHAPEAGLTVNDKFIPPGTPVGISPIVQNRDPKIWGDNAQEFWPERWLESEAKSRYLESNNMTFGGSGPRMCVGRNIALVEVHKSVAQLLRHFDMKVDNEDKPWHITSYWFAYQHDFMVQLTPREKYPLMA